MIASPETLRLQLSRVAARRPQVLDDPENGLPVYEPFICAGCLFRKFLHPLTYTSMDRNTHLNEVTMDIVFIGALALFAALIWGMTHGCAKLGERK
jgi:hypothetical protein